MTSVSAAGATLSSHPSISLFALVAFALVSACGTARVEPVDSSVARDGGPAIPDTGPSDGGSIPPDERPFMYFAINVHDFLHIDQSADTLMTLVDLFERHGVAGDFYLTPHMALRYEAERPDVIARLRDSEMAISHHQRPPFPLYAGFDTAARDLDGDAVAALVEDYETHALDMATGGTLDAPGGYEHMTALFGRPPVVASAGTRYRPAALPVYRTLGARMTIIYHETGTDLETPLQYVQGLLVRPSDFSITRWTIEGREGEPFWWNMLSTPRAAEYEPVTRLEEELAAWDAARPPFVTCLIHENNFFRRDSTPFSNIYWIDGDRARPRSAPYDLDAPDASSPRTSADQARILEAYERIVAYAAEHLRVVTSEDLVELAETAP